ncbi:uncharacterized protein CANTADRAFT_87355 [Suhomyces tanzawaensis NRRL Y-17324]|uniref:Uncharacterized protein n=1 Tax=Suhomyces tanzawaensis NRRL Y-17324 TaxID=984487 RepID=A0A1E4SP98_9ASCO|nr:uncharacterized protein CANTADRAFT_87355 [Suhomyces tanzawaensis NRRL Y-17324]ODV81351.1 hypothetical protein CANTADRAFT_87355 [Suhomyces tanzawaensis NRRL Y-17324]
MARSKQTESKEPLVLHREEMMSVAITFFEELSSLHVAPYIPESSVPGLTMRRILSRQFPFN